MRAAKSIQGVQRRWLVRRRAKEAELQQHTASCLVVQSTWRGVREWRQQRALRDVLKHTATDIQRYWRGSRGRHQWSKRKRDVRVASTTLQSVVRAKAARRHTATLQEARKESRALVVQTQWRGKAARKEAFDRRYQLKRHLHEAAIRIQSHARGKRARGDLFVRREARVKEDGAVRIQSLWRFKGRRRRGAADRGKIRGVRNRAASVLQRGCVQGFRRVQYRRNVIAATSIQRASRGRQGRGHARGVAKRKKEDKGARHLQRIFRGREVRREEMRRRRRVTRVQGMWRGRVARSLVGAIRGVREAAREEERKKEQEEEAVRVAKEKKAKASAFIGMGGGGLGGGGLGGLGAGGGIFGGDGLEGGLGAGLGVGEIGVLGGDSLGGLGAGGERQKERSKKKKTKQTKKTKGASGPAPLLSLSPRGLVGGGGGEVGVAGGMGGGLSSPLAGRVPPALGGFGVNAILGGGHRILGGVGGVDGVMGASGVGEASGSAREMLPPRGLGAAPLGALGAFGGASGGLVGISPSKQLGAMSAPPPRSVFRPAAASLAKAPLSRHQPQPPQPQQPLSQQQQGFIRSSGKPLGNPLKHPIQPLIQPLVRPIAAAPLGGLMDPSMDPSRDGKAGGRGDEGGVEGKCAGGEHGRSGGGDVVGEGGAKQRRPGTAPLSTPRSRSTPLTAPLSALGSNNKLRPTALRPATAAPLVSPLSMLSSPLASSPSRGRGALGALGAHGTPGAKGALGSLGVRGGDGGAPGSLGAQARGGGGRGVGGGAGANGGGGDGVRGGKGGEGRVPLVHETKRQEAARSPRSKRVESPPPIDARARGRSGQKKTQREKTNETTNERSKQPPRQKIESPPPISRGGSTHGMRPILQPTPPRQKSESPPPIIGGGSSHGMRPSLQPTPPRQKSESPPPIKQSNVQGAPQGFHNPPRQQQQQQQQPWKEQQNEKKHPQQKERQRKEQKGERHKGEGLRPSAGGGAQREKSPSRPPIAPTITKEVKQEAKQEVKQEVKQKVKQEAGPSALPRRTLQPSDRSRSPGAATLSESIAASSIGGGTSPVSCLRP